MMKDRLRNNLLELMQVPGLSGFENRVSKIIKKKLQNLSIESSSDRLGNLLATFPGTSPSIMLFAHMDQLGLIVRKIEKDGFIRAERVGGLPERALPSQAVLVCVDEGSDVTGVIANKSHHATAIHEKYKVVPYNEIYIDVGMRSYSEVAEAGIKIGTPIVYKPSSLLLSESRVAGTSIDDRAGCAVLLEIAEHLAKRSFGPKIHLVFSVQEEYNLRGVLPIAQKLLPDIAIQLDLILAADTPDMTDRSDVRLGGGPAISMFSFHGRGTLNGVIPHPALISLFETSAAELGLPLQRSAHIGALTDLSYVQHVGEGVASVEIGFPLRYSHSSLEVCDLNDLVGLCRLLIDALSRISTSFSLSREN